MQLLITNSFHAENMYLYSLLTTAESLYTYVYSVQIVGPYVLCPNVFYLVFYGNIMLNENRKFSMMAVTTYDAVYVLRYR